MSQYKTCSFISLSLLIGIAVFYAIMPSMLRIILSIIMIIAAMLSISKGGVLRINRDIPSCYVTWILFSVFILTGFPSNGTGSLYLLTCIILPAILQNSTKWLRQAIIITISITGINVVATYFFLIFPQFYPVMINVYGYIPSGTSKGTAGYRAGIANHYSQNGIYISICLLLLVIYYICFYQKSSKRMHKRILLLSIALTFFALVLTGKRGVLLWVVGSLFVTYVASTNKKLGRTAKLFFILLASAMIFQVLSELIPQVGYLMERFGSIGEDAGSLERLSMWRLALNKFKDAPIFGNGFWSFKDFYQENLALIWHRNNERYQRLNAHNVYLQVLCETGLVGIIIYVCAVGRMLKRTYRLIKSNINNNLVKCCLLTSFSIQIFYVLYSFTGNCLYDIVFYFYCLAISMTLSISSDLTYIRT